MTSGTFVHNCGNGNIFSFVPDDTNISAVTLSWHKYVK